MPDRLQIVKVWVSCNACGTDAFQEMLQVGGRHIGQCSKCSLIYVNPMPLFGKAGYDSISDDLPYTKLQREITRKKVELEKDQIGIQLKEIRNFAGDRLQIRRFLDVGCGPGLAVRAAVELGWEAKGVDIDSAMIRLGKDRFGVDLRCSDIIESHFSENHFNIVRVKGVLHILPNPYDVLVEVKRVLAPGGTVLITVPNEDGLLNQLRLCLGQKRKNRLGTLVLPDHTHAFTPETLKRILARSGLKIHLVKTTTPCDPAYGTVHQPRSGSSREQIMGFVWAFCAAIHKGSLLVAYAGK